MQKAEQNRTKTSFVDQITVQSKVSQLTKGCRQGCDHAHPSYKTGYVPRHYNYLKSNGKLTGKNHRDMTPSLLAQTNQHLNNNILTRDKFFSHTNLDKLQIKNAKQNNMVKYGANIARMVEKRKCRARSKTKTAVAAEAVGHVAVDNSNDIIDIIEIWSGILYIF